MGHWAQLWVTYGPIGLAGYTFIGLLVYMPVGPDVFLMALARAEHRMPWDGILAVVLAYLAALGVVYSLSQGVRRWFPKDFPRAERWIRQHGFWATLVAALTPIPLREYTAVAGYLRIPWDRWLLALVLGLTFRFTVECLIAIAW